MLHRQAQRRYIRCRCQRLSHGRPLLLKVLLLAMLGPRSYTAEDVIEIHTHGGGISAQRVLQVLLSLCSF